MKLSKTLAKESKHPVCENSPNLVTLSFSIVQSYDFRIYNYIASGAVG
jgi:hypothetical protein